MSLVSVIIPIYKVEPYLEKCILSVLAQTFQDFEIILVDDGSPDHCGAICDIYAAADSRITVIHKDNGGLSSARNAGLKIARGEYIYFLDSDDYIDPDLLEKALSGIEGFDMVSFDFRKVDERGNVLKHYSFWHGQIRWENEEDQYLFFIDIFFRYGVWSAWSRMYRKSIIDENKLYFEDNNKIFAEDLYFTFLYLVHSRSINCLDGEYYNYRIRADSIMGEQIKHYNLGRIIELIKAVEWHLNTQKDCACLQAKFPVIFMEIFRLTLLATKVRKAEDRRRIINTDIQDITYFREKSEQLFRYRADIERKYGYAQAMEILAQCQYYLDGNLLRYKVIHLLSRGLKLLKKIVTHNKQN